MIQKGLREKTRDQRDFALGAVFNVPKLSEIPDEFSLGKPVIRDQKETDFCTGYASCLASYYQEGVPLSAEYAFAVAKDGDVDTWGLGLRDIAKSQQKNGTIKLSDAPFDLEGTDEKFLRDIANWDVELRQKAQEHRKKSYFTTDGPYDAFDNLRAHMYQHKSPAIIGLLWGWSLSQVRIKDPASGGFGHAMCVIGWTKLDDELYLIVANSVGQKAGNDGVHYMGRDVINANIEKYGSYMFIDLSREEAEYYLEKGLKKDEWQVLFEQIIRFITKLFSWLK